MWNKESNDVKRLFAALSRLAEEKHIEKHGSDYKYKPSHPQRPKSEQKKEETSGSNLFTFGRNLSTSSLLSNPLATSISTELEESQNTNPSSSISSSPHTSTSTEFEKDCDFEEYFHFDSISSSASSSPPTFISTEDNENFKISKDINIPPNFPSLVSIEYDKTIESPQTPSDDVNFIWSNKPPFDPKHILQSDPINSSSADFLGFVNSVNDIPNNIIPSYFPDTKHEHMEIDYYGYISEGTLFI